MSDETSSALERLQAGRIDDDDTPFHFSDRKLQECCPQLFELLASKKSADGTRKAGKLTFFVDEGSLKCGIFLPSEARMAFVTLDRLSNVWELLESLIVSDKVDWRRDKRNGKPSVSRF